MATITFEVTGKFDEQRDCSALLYAPLAGSATFLQARIYRFDYDGDREQLRAFVYRTLVDHHAHEFNDAGDPAITGHDFFLEIGMKPGVLDNEKEAVLEFYRSQVEPGFDLVNLQIFRRYYIFGSIEVEIFVRDMCNPAVHSWQAG